MTNWPKDIVKPCLCIIVTATRVDAEPFGDEVALWVKEQVLQREVEIEVESQDKAGNFIGGSNLSFLTTTSNNLASVQATCSVITQTCLYNW